MGKLLPDITLTSWPLINLVIFVVFFTSVVIWVYRPSAKKTYSKFSTLPLEKEEHSNER